MQGIKENEIVAVNDIYPDHVICKIKYVCVEYTFKSVSRSDMYVFLLCILIKEKVYKLYIFDFEEVQVENNEMKFMSNRSLD